MDRNSKYFYISGLISISFFLFVISLAIFTLSSNRVKNFALTKDNYISVSIDMSFVDTKSSVIKPASKKSSKSKDIDIGDLFSDVWTQSIKDPKDTPKKVNRRRLQEIQKKIKSSDDNRVESLSKVVKSIDSKELSKESSKKSTAFEVNEYLAKIQALVYNYFYPPANSQGNTLKAVIELSAIGKVLDFRILNYSSNKDLNDECDKIKGRLMNIVFPENPYNTSGTYIITLTSEE